MDFSERELVIKAKYGDNLKRFGTYVHEQTMDLNMAKLRSKIIQVFKFPLDVDFTLSYIDEDGDIVMLDDDDELYDAAINQRLSPLRINVNLRTHSVGNSNKESNPAPSAPSSDIRTESAQVGNTVIETLNSIPEPIRGLVSQISQEFASKATSSGIVEAMKSLPEPLRGVASQISQDLVSKAASSSPVFGDLADYFLKLGFNNINNQVQVPNDTVATAVDSTVSHTVPSPSANVTSDPIQMPHPAPNMDSHNTNIKGEVGGSSRSLRELGSVPVSFDKISVKNMLSSGSETTKDKYGGKILDSNTQVSNIPTGGLPTSQASFPTAVSGEVPSSSMNSSQNHGNVNTSSEQTPPISFVASPQSEALPFGSIPAKDPYRRVGRFHENMIGTFHRGVQCDGCGMLPILGPRFKSVVKDDYDLCNLCFSNIGNKTDFRRIDRASYRPPRVFKERFGQYPRCRPYSFGETHDFEMRSFRGKHNSRFIQDVTILDGTTMPPLTPFTKIWRLRNNGTILWPSGTRLVWIGGDNLGLQGSIPQQITINGCAVDEEIDIAVDFVAPQRPGRYISYWKLALPSGQKFGQRIWVLIQVESQANFTNPSFSASDERTNIDLNVPQENSIAPTGVVEPSVAEYGPNPRKSAPFTSPISYPVIEPSSSNEVLIPTAPKETSSPPFSYPLVYITESSPPPSLLIDLSGSSSPSAFGEMDNVEQSLLKELEEMGFKQVELNKEVLRQNEYNLEQSVDDLCGYAEWEPLLSELHEMGFENKETNKKLLVKNGGSIKRVVLDLIASERDV